MNEVSYDIVIPGLVNHDLKLTPLEKLLYGEIRGLCRKEGYCWASNPHLAERLQTSTRTIQRGIQKLIKRKHIHIEKTESNQNLRKIYLSESMTPVSQGMTPVSSPMTRQSPEGMTPVSRGKDCIRKKAFKDKKEYPPTSDEFIFSLHLLDLIRKRKPDYKQPNLQKWAVSIDRMIRKDSRTPDRIRQVIEFAQTDSFWQNNILSTDKLRKHFDKLELQMNSKKPSARIHARTYQSNDPEISNGL